MDYLTWVQQFFAEMDWPTAVVEGTPPAIHTSYNLEEHSIHCLAAYFAAQPCLLFYSILPTIVPAEQRSEMAFLIAYANDEMLIGNFELNLEEGLVRYKSVVDMGGWTDAMRQDEALLRACWQEVVGVNLQMMVSYLPSLLAVARGENTAVEAIALVENNQEEA